MNRFILMILIVLISALGIQAQDSWQKHDSPVSVDLHNVFFASDSIGWITTHKTGEILHTNDSGNNWFLQAKLDSMYIEDIYFLNKNVGWISGQYGLVFKTVDGGKNWEKHKIADDKSWIYSLHFFNKKKGIAVGMREETPAAVYLKTSNRGNNWIDMKEMVPRSPYEPVTFLNDQEGYIGGLGKIIYTDNGGNTWQTQFSDSTSSSDCKTMIRGLTFVTKKTGWAVGHCGVVLKTEDGKNWKHRGKFTQNRLRSIAFVNESEGYIVGDSNNEPGVLYHTKDGGKTWKTVLSNASDLHRIELTEGKIWLVGDDGTILSKSR